MQSSTPEFKKYRHTGISEMRAVTQEEISDGLQEVTISISDVDVDNGSPLPGDMIARNPLNHNDQWLVAKKYFNDNMEEIN